MDKYALKIKPYVSETIWGGRKLIDNYGVVTEKVNAAEAWMLSCHPDGTGTVINGLYEGKTLIEVLEKNRDWCGLNARKFSDFPVLIKFIDAMDNLSIQVHPDDEYCRITGKGSGKTECWYILDSEKDACLLLGTNRKMTTDEFRRAIDDGNLTDYIGKISVKPGDFFFIDSGTIHAICKGVLLAEVQQSSNTTYRVFDYNRLGKDGKPRELHIEDAVNVSKLEPYSRAVINCSRDETETLVDCDYFKVRHIGNSGQKSYVLDVYSFVSLLILSGEGEVGYLGGNYPVKKGESLFLPANDGEYTLSGNLEVLETRI